MYQYGSTVPKITAIVRIPIKKYGESNYIWVYKSISDQDLVVPHQEILLPKPEFKNDTCGLILNIVWLKHIP